MKATAIFLVMLVVIPPVSAVTLDTADGLQITFSDSTGGVTAVSSGGVNVPLLEGKWGGLAVKPGRRIAPANRLSMDFAASGGPWTSAQNSNWNIGAYVTWQSTGGIGDSGHLLLGNGSTAGAGMALANPIDSVGSSRVKISWQARVANTATLQIACVRIYDAGGNEITASTPAPSGWMYSTTSQAHVVPSIQCASPDVWQRFEYAYLVSSAASSLRISLRYWNGGDGWVHIDDLNVHVTGGITWGTLTPVSGPIQPVAGGFTQSVSLAGNGLQISTTAQAAGGKMDFRITLQDTSAEERPVLVYWMLPVSAAGWQWWDDLDTSRTVASGVYKNTHTITAHAVGWYPYAAVSNADCGVAMAVPMSEPLVQRFECEAATGLYSLWEIGLSPVTTKLGAGRASFTCSLYATDPAWGFRSAAAKYQTLYPELFVKRTTAEGTWEWPVHPSGVPNPLDFGWVYHESYPIDDPAERALCKSLGIGIYHYVEPWLFWDSWGIVAAKPTYEERVTRLNSWAAAEAPGYVSWQSSGGVNDSGHLTLGDGGTAGAGMATGQLSISGGTVVRLSWQAKVADTDTLQILGVRIYNSAGADMTATTPAPSGFGYSSGSNNHYVASIANSLANTWQPFACTYTVPAAAATLRVSVRYWNQGDGWVQIDDLKVQNLSTGTAYLDWGFAADGGGWVSALNADWENPANLWKREQRQISARAVIDSSPLDADGRYSLDYGYISQLSATGSYQQGWPVNSDPDLPAPSAYTVQFDKWILYRLDEADGIYIDSVTTGAGLGEWENRRPDHLAVADYPLTFSCADGGAAQLAPQAHEEFLQPVGEELHARGKLFMFNLFPEAARFHAHQGDVQGCEVFQLVPPPAESHVQRALAGKRVVTNLLQYNWDLPYASSAEVEQYIRDELFWGFFPGISSIGGPMNGGAPDRYFLHPELYERDRALFRRYIPVIRALGAAGWEAITFARGTPAAEMERFGDFSRGPVYLTLRGPNFAAFAGQVTVDLTGCGALRPTMQVSATDGFTGSVLPVTRTGQSLLLDCTILAGDVGVVRLNATRGIPDFTGDLDVDQEDFGHLQACFSGATLAADPNCRDARLDHDEDVDAADLDLFLRCLKGPEGSPPPNCLDE